MKIFYSESLPDYKSYTFNYGIYCLKEDQAELPMIYDKGFLPYTGNVSLEYDIFYLARSLRVDLNDFEDTSENRRINRKMADLQIEVDLHEKNEFLAGHRRFKDFAMAYCEARIGEAMPEERLDYILTRTTGTNILSFTLDDEPVGYVLAVLQGSMLHYWFSFFDVQMMETHPLGKWMMWKSITMAKDLGLKQVYLGTCYGTKSLYKVRDHRGLAYYDGFRWNKDMSLLKSLCKSDIHANPADQFKRSNDANDYLKQIFEWPNE